VDGRDIAVANLGEGQFRALGDICSHAHAHLHEGEVDVDFETIECPRHGSTFDLETGKPRGLPATMPVPVYNVKIEGDEVKVEIDG
jgi:3-phenylpropionate/trans-cinnamate dioxygenase ferredoxin subunit